MQHKGVIPERREKKASPSSTQANSWARAQLGLHGYNSQNGPRPGTESISWFSRIWTHSKESKARIGLQDKDTPLKPGPLAGLAERPSLEAIPVFHSCPQVAQGSSVVKQLLR